MPATDPAAVPRRWRSSLRAAHLIWIAIAGTLALVLGIGILAAVAIYQQQAAIREIDALGGHVVKRDGGP